jgi:hypothetical protein
VQGNVRIIAEQPSPAEGFLREEGEGVATDNQVA